MIILGAVVFLVLIFGVAYVNAHPAFDGAWQNGINGAFVIGLLIWSATRFFGA